MSGGRHGGEPHVSAEDVTYFADGFRVFLYAMVRTDDALGDDSVDMSAAIRDDAVGCFVDAGRAERADDRVEPGRHRWKLRRLHCEQGGENRRVGIEGFDAGGKSAEVP